MTDDEDRYIRLLARGGMSPGDAAALLVAGSDLFGAGSTPAFRTPNFDPLIIDYVPGVIAAGEQVLTPTIVQQVGAPFEAMQADIPPGTPNNVNIYGLACYALVIGVVQFSVEAHAYLTTGLFQQSIPVTYPGAGGGFVAVWSQVWHVGDDDGWELFVNSPAGGTMYFSRLTIYPLGESL